MLNDGLNVQECDAIGLNGYSTAGFKKILL